MKKVLAVTLAIALIFTLCACSIGGAKATEGNLGIGIVSAASGKDGKANFNATVAAVVLDKDGKIVKCKIDAIQNAVDIKDGKITAPDKAFMTKYELGASYGMKEISPIKKEWFEQADHFADYVVGLTGEQVEAIAVTEKNGQMVATEQLILSGCTIGVSDFIKAVSAACNDKNMKKFSGSELELGLGIESSVDSYSSKNADAGEGVLKLESDIVAAVTGKDGKVIAMSLDAVAPSIKFDATGTVTNAADAIVSKKALGDNYGMKAASGIGKEWYEQAAALEDYIVGLDAIGINSINLGDDGKPTDSVLKAGCTVAISGYLKAAEKATK